MKSTMYAPKFTKQVNEIEKYFLAEVENMGCKPNKKTLETYPCSDYLCMRVEGESIDENGNEYGRAFHIDINVDCTTYIYGVLLSANGITEE